jgi:hypothetical protein
MRSPHLRMLEHYSGMFLDIYNSSCWRKGVTYVNWQVYNSNSHSVMETQSMFPNIVVQIAIEGSLFQCESIISLKFVTC